MVGGFQREEVSRSRSTFHDLGSLHRMAKCGRRLGAATGFLNITPDGRRPEAPPTFKIPNRGTWNLERGTWNVEPS